MLGLQKRLERLKSTSTIAGGFVSAPLDLDDDDSGGGGGDGDQDPAPLTPELKSRSSSMSRTGFEHSAGGGSGGGGGGGGVFSLLLMGISKSSATSARIQQAVDDSLRSSFDFAPKRFNKFVQAVHLCRHPVAEEHFAVLVFHTKMVAELFLEAYALKRADLPFAADGKQVRVEPNHKSGQFRRFGLLSKYAAVYLSGLPTAWADVHPLKQHFEKILQSARVDFGSNMVKVVQILPGAAYVGFSRKAVVDLLIFKCWRDRSLLGEISDELVMVAAKTDGTHGTLRAPEQQPQQPQRTLVYSDLTLAELVNAKRGDQPRPDKLPIRGHRSGQPEAGFKQPAVPPQTMVRQEVSAVVDQAVNQPRPAVRREVPGVDQAAGQPRAVERRDAAAAFQKLTVHEKHAAGGTPPSSSGKEQDKTSAAAQSIHQRSVFLVFSNPSKVDYDALCRLVGMLVEMARPDASVESRLFRIYTGPQILFQTEAMADSILDLYVTRTEAFHVEDCPFSVARHELYLRPGAVYRQPSPCPASHPMKTLVITNLGGLRVREELLRGAASEMLDRMLLTTGLLTAGRSLLHNLSYTMGLSYAVAKVEEPVAENLLSCYPSFLLAGRRVSLSPPASVPTHASVEQTTLYFKSLPSATAGYNPEALTSLLRRMLSKVRPDLSTFGILFAWVPGDTKGRANLPSEAVADAIMDAYVAHTEEFCIEELPMTIYRNNMYQRPGARYRPAGCSSGGTRQLTVLGLGGGLQPLPLRGALNELVERTVAISGVLEYGQPTVRYFFYLKGSSTAQLTVDEGVAQELVTRCGLTLAGRSVTFVAPGPAVRPMPAPTAQMSGGDRTGGWIDAEDGEVLPGYLDHCMQATLQSYGYTR